eukprot:TRINITY_DN1337_c0_g1_i1.p1 TRINITY_DN1337_c0_g1~~TRINITY_DN1337_c0_g1_i1.p1  ORF type:complete len:545 (-),score=113.92 TRINITY_DN1337_c0_g1_i1:911-2518(-)
MFTDQLVSFEDFQAPASSPAPVIMQSSELGPFPESHIRFQKDSVYVHPSRDEAIQGTLFLLERKNQSGIECFLSWTPKAKGQNADKQQRDQLYALQIPLRDVGSIKRYVPTLGIPHIVVVTTTGIAFPPFYFYTGGVREFLAALKEEVTLLRSDEDPTMLLVSNSPHSNFMPPKRSSTEFGRSSLGLDASQLRTSFVGLPPSSPGMIGLGAPVAFSPALGSVQPLPYAPYPPYGPPPPGCVAYPPQPLVSSTISAPPLGGLYPSLPPLVMSSSSPAASSLSASAPAGAPAPVPSAPASPARAVMSASAPATPGPDDSNGVWKPTPVENFAWSLLEGLSKVPKLYRMGMEAPGRLLREFDAALQSVADVPVASRSPDAADSSNSSAKILSTLHPSHSTAIGAFELVDREEESRVPHVLRTEEISESDWCMFFDEQGRISNEAEVRRRIHYGGLTPSIRPEAWRFLLGFYPFSSTYEERDAILSERRYGSSYVRRCMCFSSSLSSWVMDSESVGSVQFNARSRGRLWAGWGQPASRW